MSESVAETGARFRARSMVIREDPAQFLKTVAAILPKELHAELDVNVELFARARTYSEAYDMALKFIGAEVDEPVLVEASDAAE